MSRRTKAVQIRVQYSLRLLGSAQVLRGKQIPMVLERKPAILLAYLALEGPTPRPKLSGLLWPDSGEEAARTNLRKLLQRLRENIGDEVLVAEDTLRLAPDLEVDAVTLETLSFTGDFTAVAGLDGELLAGFNYDDCPDIADWLDQARERLEATRLEALGAESERLETAGQYTEALDWAERLLSKDPLSEETYRRIMRLHYLLGDRSSALKAFQRCQEVLQRELKLEPMPETQELARLIEHSNALVQPNHIKKPTPPLTVLRPPVLVGREGEWNQMQVAWEAGQILLVVGIPGAGKTRLLQDFLAANVDLQTLNLAQSHPGDTATPFASQARHFRELLKKFSPALEPWVQKELARILPELGEAPEPMQSEVEKLRFFQALVEALQQAMAAGLRTIAWDDLQFVDAASQEALEFILANLNGCRMLIAYRKGELSDKAERSVNQLLEAGTATKIEVGPLTPEATQGLLQSLKLPDLNPKSIEPLAERLTQYTGGNPLFLLETLRHLMERQVLTDDLPERLPPPGKVATLIQSRLQKLSNPARELAWMAAVGGQQFDLELAAKVLEQSPLALAQSADELENSNFLRQNRFTHDLLHEATLVNIPTAIKKLLHSRTLDLLKDTGTSASVLVQHAIGSDRVPEIFQYSIKASQEAASLRDHELSVQHLNRAQAILEERTGGFDPRKTYSIPELAFVYFKSALRSNFSGDSNARRLKLRKLVELAREMQDPILEACAWCEIAESALEDGGSQLDANTKAASLIAKLKHPGLHAVHEHTLSNIVMNTNPNEEEAIRFSLRHSGRSLALARRFLLEKDKHPVIFSASSSIPGTVIMDAHRVMIRVLEGRADLETELGLWAAAEKHLKEMEEIAGTNGIRYNRVYSLKLRAISQLAQGNLMAGTDLARECVAIAPADWVPRSRIHALPPLLSAYLEQGLYPEVISTLESHQAPSDPRGVMIAKMYVGLAWLELGCLQLGLDILREARNFFKEQSLIGRPSEEATLVALCYGELLQGRISQAGYLAVELESVKSHPRLFSSHGPSFCKWNFQAEALLYGGYTNEAKANIEKRRPFVADKPRYRIPHLRSEAVLARWEERPVEALNYLDEALALAKQIGLPGEIWQIEAERSRVLDMLDRTEASQEASAQATALVHTLADRIPDQEMRETYLKFTHRYIHAQHPVFEERERSVERVRSAH